MSLDQENFNAANDRGVFTADYKPMDCFVKLLEEVGEVREAISDDNLENYKEELMDVIITAQNELIRIGANIAVEKHKCWIKNKGRVRNAKI